ncbi:RhoGAP-domain-containing protein [Lichtheimia hyalospora FSU 10163]|nr:RhoGAP-domain-containing protein [Lichtheimia hyalospora FSU 10163]
MMKNQRPSLRASLWRRHTKKSSFDRHRACLPPTGLFDSKTSTSTHTDKHNTTTTTKDTDVIPILLVKCKQELLTRALLYVQGLHVEGIFRRSGSSATIERLLREFNESSEPDCIALDTIPVHTIAGLFKRFLQQLSEPVIPRSFQPEFLHIFESTTDVQERRQRLATTCKSLPPWHGSLLSFVLAVAHTISCHRDENKMSAENLAIIFAPTCIRLDAISHLLPDHSPALSSSMSTKSFSFSSQLGGSKLFRNASLKRRHSSKKLSNHTSTSTTSLPCQEQRWGDICKSILFSSRRENGKPKDDIPQDPKRPIPRYEPEKLMQLDLVKAQAWWSQLFELMINDPPFEQMHPFVDKTNIHSPLDPSCMDDASTQNRDPLSTRDTPSTVYFDSLDEQDPAGRTMLDILDDTMAALSEDTAAFFGTMVPSEKLLSHRSKRGIQSDQSSAVTTLTNTTATAPTPSPPPATMEITTPVTTTSTTTVDDDSRESPRFAGTKYEAVWQHWREREAAERQQPQPTPGPAPPRSMKRSSGVPHHAGDWLKALSQHHFVADKQRPLSLTFMPRSPAQQRLSAFLR